MIFSISGVSCAGKTTLLEGLRASIPGLQPMESVTTRPGRPSDQPGEYRYVDDDEFDRIKSNGVFAWTVQPFGGPYRYGTAKLLVESALRSQKIYAPILTVETVDTLYEFAKERGSEKRFQALLLTISNVHRLEERFRHRGDSSIDIEIRLRSAYDEAHRLCTRFLDNPTCPVTYRFINAELPKQEVLAQAIYYIQHPHK